MANLLKMTVVQSILSLHAQGWSHRRIATRWRSIGDTVGSVRPPAASGRDFKCSQRAD